MSNDNPFIESFFKTLKHKIGYPGSCRNIEHTREWLAFFVHWYSHQHLHSAIGYVTPSQRQTGLDEKSFEQRNQTMQEARKKNPGRWGSRKVRTGSTTTGVVLNPGKKVWENKTGLDRNLS